MPVSTTLGRFNELIETGFQVTDVSSTWEHVIVVLAKGDKRVTLKLDAEDARSLVAGEEPTTARRVAASKAP